MANYTSIKDHDILAERSSNLQKFTVGFFLLLAFIVASYAVFDGISEAQRMREASVIKKIHDAKVGSFVKVGDSGLLKMSQRRDK